MDGDKKPVGSKREIVQRKEDHIDLVLAQRAVTGISEDTSTRGPSSCFDRIRLEHSAMPELDLKDIDLSAEFLGHQLSLPCLISSMTGGPSRAEAINAHLAEAAQELNIAMGVGSQRVALETGADAGLAKSIRRRAPDIALFANLGAVQLTGSIGITGAQKAVEMLEANALILHFNPLQELLQPGGDTDWSGIADKIEQLAGRLDVPIIAKEVGFGIGPKVARQLRDLGVAAIDVAGRGGTDFAAVELARNGDPVMQAMGSAFAGWGIDTVTCLQQLGAQALDCQIIASGGIRNGVDAAKAIALGATLVAQAGPVLRAALHSTDAVLDHFATLTATIRAACMLTGSPSLADLPNALFSK